MTVKLIENAGIKVYAGSELEEWRGKTLLEKEPETIAWLDRCAERGGVLWDVGANLGLYGIYAAARNPDLTVYSFEPVRQNYAALLGNLALNKLLNVHPFHVALGSRSHLAPLYVPDDRVGNSGAQTDRPVDERGGAFQAKEVQRVFCLSAHSLVREFGLQAPNYVKLDVDGHEVDILAGMGELIAAPEFQSVLVEFNSQRDMEEQSRAFEASGFIADDHFNGHPRHSKHRRQGAGGVAMNVVFSRWATERTRTA